MLYCYILFGTYLTNLPAPAGAKACDHPRHIELLALARGSLFCSRMLCFYRFFKSRQDFLDKPRFSKCVFSVFGCV